MRKFLNDYGTLLVFLFLCLVLSYLTLSDQTPEGADAGKRVAEQIAKSTPKPEYALVLIRDNAIDQRFADAAVAELESSGIKVAGVVKGAPAGIRAAAAAVAGEGGEIGALACTALTGRWPILRTAPENIPAMADAKIHMPETYRWPTFLQKDNLINVSNQIVVIATIAIGMTLVIITGGIELSVGSILAFASCLAAWFIKEWSGGESAGTFGMIGFSALAIILCGFFGLFTGSMVTIFSIPPFIVTLANMMVVSGLAYIISGGHSIYQLPWSYTTLGRGTVFWGIPISVAICLLLYIAAHILMTKTTTGRYIYAVGGNREAARLSGVPVRFILYFVYVVAALLAGFGGVITASQLKSGSPTYGLSYEMFAIASVVVGGTSLSGGEGKIFGTLIGSLIIGVIQNGMNLLGVESYTQKVVLGLVILGAVLLDRVKHSTFLWSRK